MEPVHIIILLLTGVIAGFAGGLLGLGGAFIMTPFQCIVYTDMGLSPELVLLTAFGTSLLAVLPTSISGAWRHHRNHSVMWRTALVMGPCSAVIALVGATIAARLPERALSIAFGILLLLSGARMLLNELPGTRTEAETRPWVWLLWAIPVGFISGLFGVGGGIVLIPVLVSALHFEIRYAIGTSLAVIIFTSLGGIVGYIINGLGVSGRLEHSIGYINLTSFLLIVIPSIIMAQVGAITAHRIPRKPLLYAFLTILFFTSLRMLGLFDWLGWTI